MSNTTVLLLLLICCCHVLSMMNMNQLTPGQTTLATTTTDPNHLEDSDPQSKQQRHYYNSDNNKKQSRLSEPYKIHGNYTIEEITNILLKNYEKSHRPGHLGEPTVVEVNMYVQRFGSINVIDMDYSIDILLRQRWLEHRLRYVGLNRTLSLSYLKKSLWIPDLFFRNSKYGFLHDITTPNNLIWLQPNGMLTFSQKLTVKLSCPMKLWNFPMDVQVCPLELGSYGFALDEMEFIWWKNRTYPVTLNRNLVLNEFEIPNVSVGNCSKAYSTTGSFACLFVRFRMERKYGFYLIYTYLPSILIVTISWISFWIDYRAVPARITLGLLCVLALMTQSAATVQKLPRVSYVKAIDVWLFVCLAFVVAALLEFALVNMIARRKEQNRLRNELRGMMMKEMRTLRGNFRVKQKKEAAGEVIMDEDDGRNHLMEDKVSNMESGEREFQADKIDNVFVFAYPTAFVVFNLIYWLRYLFHRMDGEGSTSEDF